MKKTYKTRIGIIVISLIVAIVGLLLFALNSDLNHYYSLEKLNEAPKNKEGIRVGGMVEVGSFKRVGESLELSFSITDFRSKSLKINYTGILPDLFREGQGIIAKGKLLDNGEFIASEILAKHDENYMPSELKEDLLKSPHADKYFKK